ncbi:GTP 3',8-cyclase MoaA [Calditerrivibrio nitroreducens]|uniref:GTP 3',8-cyclase n=1 Tax=Calditerrivibrio nitroreducens TaxID=477976 RepID=A0A2J6WGI5_9BACT|nr:MAG: GTP 3',8-cyclase MoaA [Calditerrivibrio nitroreducens]
MNELTDKYGRTYRYLRVSVTDRCNFRCKYCIPTHNFKFIDHSEILRYEDLIFALKIFSKYGIKKIRLTGGEPLVRKGLTNFISNIKSETDIEEITLTTNGSLLTQFAENLKKAGINRINVSIDSLKPERYQLITGGFDLNNIIDGIKSAQDAGLFPIKINTVLIKGFNDDEIVDFCHFAADNNVTVRFIEFMPIGNSIGWNKDAIIRGKEILDIIREHFSLTKIEKHKFEGPALNYKLSNGARIGIITPISNHFCGECDKLRITPDGKLRPCLLSDREIDLTYAIKMRDEDLFLKKIKESLDIKDWSHHISDCESIKFNRTMSKIGG